MSGLSHGGWAARIDICPQSCVLTLHGQLWVHILSQVSMDLVDAVLELCQLLLQVLLL